MAALKNAKHEAFAQGLAKGLSASDAYVSAGYKESRSAASRLSTNVNIEARVAELLTKSADRAEIDIARVLKELVRLGTSDIREAFTDSGHLKHPGEWSDDFAASVASVETVSRNTGTKDEDGRVEIEHIHKIKVWDKNSALEKIAKHLGMFIERVDHTSSDGSMTPKFEVEFVDPVRPAKG
ncbi:MAG: terminase small subunit [Pseudaminobacter sp.]